MVEKELRVKGINYMLLALNAFAGLGVEVIYALLLEPIIYGKQMNEWNVSQSIIHWIITCITWGVITYIIVKTSKTRFGFDIFKKEGNMKTWQWLGVAVCIIFSLSVSYWDWNGFKVIKEYQYNGLLKFIFQYIYYVFETLLFTLILVYGQIAFEVWFKKRNIPYGGILLAVTWGLVHILTKGSVTVGLLSALGGFTYGIAYLLVNRDIKKTVPILFIMFIL
ncbi:MAG TPA: hypothetical protein VHP81_08850 [Lachnospiraceae bacterium]|nr:hypothetical protein [Lachnospiraceae bacterium]